MFACLNNHEKCVELLLSSHADANIRDTVCWFVMHNLLICALLCRMVGQLCHLAVSVEM